jgi:hypothetical protein
LDVELTHWDAHRGVAGFFASAHINRADFGLEFPLPGLGGGALLSKDVAIEITLATVLAG